MQNSGFLQRGSFSKLKDCTIYVAKTQALINCAATMQLIWVFVFSYRKAGFLMTRLKLQYKNLLQTFANNNGAYRPALWCRLVFIIKIRSWFLYEPRREKTCLWGFEPGPTQARLYSHRRWLRGLKFWIKEIEGFYYPCSENKDADQLSRYSEADLFHYFGICKRPVFS